MSTITAAEGRRMLFKSINVDGLNIFYREAGSEARDREAARSIPTSRHGQAGLHPRPSPAGAYQPRQLEHGLALSRSAQRPTGPARFLLRLSDERTALPAVAGVPQKATA